MGPLSSVEMVTRSPEETQALGRVLGQAAQGGDVFLLVGPLGAGKTCLIQGIAQGLGVEEPARSPTFVLVTEHQGRLPLYHVDLYRIEGPGEAQELGLEEYMEGDGVCAVEWAERAMALFPADHVLVELQLRGEGERSVRLSAWGGRRSLRLLGCVKRWRDGATAKAPRDS